VGILSFRSLALWVLGYPEAALADADCALHDAREIGHAATLMYALGNATIFTHLQCGSYTARAEVEELLVLADEKSALFWKALGTLTKSCLLALDGNNSDAIQMLTSGIAAYRLTGATLHVPLYLSYLARAQAELGQFDDAWRCIDEAMTLPKRLSRRSGRPRSIAPPEKLLLRFSTRVRQERKRISSARSQSRGNSKLSPGNCAQR
jgi:hypothetical protein